MNDGVIWACLTLGLSGASCSLLFPARTDHALRKARAALLAWLARLQETPASADLDLELTARLTASLRAGLSLDSALENAAREAPPGSPARARIRRVLDRRPGPDFLSRFLGNALANGMPALAPLHAFHKALAARRRLRLKAGAATGQSRAQAEVLSWLPWALALSLLIVDADWFLTAARSPLAWALWAVAIALTGLGRCWIRRTLARALSPRTPGEKLEEEVLPDFLLQLLAELSLGQDIDSAIEGCIASLSSPALRACFTDPTPPLPERVAALKGLLRHAANTGAPVRDDLLAFLQELQFELEARWEERVQRLPVALLAPLFACFFPSSLLVLLGLLLPLLLEAW